MIELQRLTRVFRINSQTVPDPSPQDAPEIAFAHLAVSWPALAHYTLGEPVVEGNLEVYPAIKPPAQTKGGDIEYAVSLRGTHQAQDPVGAAEAFTDGLAASRAPVYYVTELRGRGRSYEVDLSNASARQCAKGSLSETVVQAFRQLAGCIHRKGDTYVVRGRIDQAIDAARTCGIDIGGQR
jgi:hypothetical protein